MTQVEHVVLSFIRQNPGCTRQDIDKSFASSPSEQLLAHAISGLESQVLIYQDIKNLPNHEENTVIQFYPLFA